MDLKEISNEQKDEYNKCVTHIVQSWEWGEFRQNLGTKLKRFGLYENGQLKVAFHLSFHKIPFTNYLVGYLAKGPVPDKNLGEALIKIGKEENCAFIKIEPNIESGMNKISVDKRFKKSPKPHFTKYNYVIDLTQDEQQILSKMHQKFRYNIKIAEKHGVFVEERTDDEAFEIYLKLFFETCSRQNYFGHTPQYHKEIWEILKKAGLARVAIAFYTPSGLKKPLPLNAWMLVNFHDTLYYPYGGSSAEYKNVMATNKTAWEAIKFGKKLNLKYFDLWGAADPNAPENDSYKGFTRFKSGTGARLVEYIDTYDLVFNPLVFWTFTFVDIMLPLKVFLLKLIRPN
ncbi:MAG: peptidoglycan bridge formation glycyltransferase FemA/FemB family protein [Candidatus Daviesbacteria bacterium]|nr:peptidoglycan bridge formation glycyltransferase FemA/FemB family protein [Candidatus Daviesbacteria bacterium]